MPVQRPASTETHTEMLAQFLLSKQHAPPPTQIMHIFSSVYRPIAEWGAPSKPPNKDTDNGRKPHNNPVPAIRICMSFFCFLCFDSLLKKHLNNFFHLNIIIKIISYTHLIVFAYTFVVHLFFFLPLTEIPQNYIYSCCSWQLSQSEDVT